MAAGAQESAWLIGTCIAASGPQGSSEHMRFFSEPLAKAQQTQDVRSGIAIGSSDVTNSGLDRMALKPLSLVDWISDALSQGYTNLQSLVKCLDHRNIVSDTVCSQAKVVL